MHRKIEDMEEGASNMKENVAMNGALQDFRLKTDPSYLKLFPKPKSFESGTLKNLFKLSEINLKSHSTDNPKRLSVAPAFRKIPEFQVSPTLKKLSESKALKPLDLTVPKWRVNKHWKQMNKLNDSNISPSNVDEQVVDVTKGRKVPRLGLPSLLPHDLSATRRAPFAFKNLLKLKDVELMSPKSTKVQIELPLFKPASRVNDKLISSPGNKDCDIKQTSTQSNVQLIPRGRKAETEILDALPSASENDQVITANENSAQEQDGSTNASANNQLITADENSLEQQNGSIENSNENVLTGTGQKFISNSEAGTTNNKEFDAESNQNIEQIPTQQFSKIPEGGEQDFDSYDDSFELLIDGNSASGIDQIILNIENEPSSSEISLGEESIPEKEEVNEGFDVTGQGIDESLFSEGSNFSGIESRDGKIVTNEHTVEPNLIILEKEVEKEPVVLSDSIGSSKCSCEAKSTPEKENQFMEVNHNEEILKQEELPRRNVLPNLRESIVLRLHNLQKPNGKILSLSRLTKQDDKNIMDNKERSSVGGISAVDIEPTKIRIIEKSAHNVDDGTSTKDLQEGSNSSLQQSYTDQDVRASNNLESKAHIHRTLNTNDPTQLDDENETFGDSSDEDTHTSDLGILDSTHHTNIFETVTASTVPLEHLHTNAKDDVSNVDFNQGVTQNLSKESTCQASIDSFNSATSSESIEKVATETEPREMAVEASEHRASIFPSLRQQVLEPSLFPPITLNPPVLPNLGDILNGNSQLPPVPSLDDIASSISNLFEGNARAANDEDLSSSEFDPITDCTHDNPVMSTDASTTNSKSTISGLQSPFENINLDIFQLNPLRPLEYKMPSLNLNSFKTKLAVPKMLDFRPVKLQSSLGKDGSLLGATLTFGPSKFGAVNAKKPMFRSSVLNRKPSLLLGNPLETLGKSNAENLLRTPLNIPTINSLETLKATKTLGDNIRSHTENTVRNLHHSLASTLNEARINNAGEKLAKPRVDLLELVSNAHEDMKDKLHGIHTDLKDRLETLQDHITEQTNLPTLTMPRLPNVLKLESPFSATTTSGYLRQSQPTKFKKSQRKPGFRVNKPSQRSKTGQDKLVNQQANLRPFKLSKAASNLTPKSVEVPKLIVTSVKPPFAKPLERHSNVKLRKSMAIQEPVRLNQNERPLLKLTENGQSASSSSFRPVSASTSFKTKSTRPILSLRRVSTQGNEGSVSKWSRPISQSRLNFQDTSGFASEVRSSRVMPNIKPKHVPSDPDSTQLQSTPAQVLSLETSADKTLSIPNFKDLKVKEMSSEKLPELKKPAFTLPKSTESPLIAKLRESLKLKLPSPKLKSKGTQLTNDMAKSASENNAVILSQEPMKENVSYKCKMVCYKES